MENSRSSSDIGVISDSGVDRPFYQKVKNRYSGGKRWNLRLKILQKNLDSLQR